jgi:membrane protein
VTPAGVKPRHYRLDYRIAEFLRRLWQKSIEDDVFFMAGAIAFNLLVALVPLLILGIGIAGYLLSARFGDPTEALLALVVDNLPQAGRGVALADALRDPVTHLVDQRTGFTVLGAVTFVWLSTRLVSTLRIALREIFDIGQQRGILLGKLFDIQVVLVGLVLMSLNLGVTVVFEGVMDLGIEFLGLRGTTLSLAQWLIGHALAFLSIWTLLLIVYRYLPARRIPWRTSLVAATFTAVLHESLKWGFSWYATEVANYGSTLGNLATVAVLFFWIYYGSIVFILGGEVAQVYTMRKASRIGVVSFESES